jgi:hypothetical protein
MFADEIDKMDIEETPTTCINEMQMETNNENCEPTFYAPPPECKVLKYMDGCASIICSIMNPG